MLRKECDSHSGEMERRVSAGRRKSDQQRCDEKEKRSKVLIRNGNERSRNEMISDGNEMLIIDTKGDGEEKIIKER